MLSFTLPLPARQLALCHVDAAAFDVAMRIFRCLRHAADATPDMLTLPDAY